MAHQSFQRVASFLPEGVRHKEQGMSPGRQAKTCSPACPAPPFFLAKLGCQVKVVTFTVEAGPVQQFGSGSAAGVPPVSKANFGLYEERGAVENHIHYESQVLNDGKAVPKIESADAFTSKGQRGPVQPITVQEAYRKVFTLDQPRTAATRPHEVLFYDVRKGLRLITALVDDTDARLNN